MRCFIWTCFILALLVSASPALGSGRGAEAAGTPTPTIHRMPCPHGVFPDALTVSWNVSFIDLHPSKGRVVIRDAGLVRHIFHVVCGWDLTYYGAHFVRNCPAARSIETYHLRFQHGNKSALRLIERYLGCLDTGVEGRPRLGTVWVDVTSMLPQWLIEKMGGIAWSR